jgi:N6-L-threonylcarbamoyladenine synthase
MLILAIESSCDETAVAVVRDTTTVLSSVISSQVELHAPFGGVVPEIASRAHFEALQPLLRAALHNADVTAHDIDAFAATEGPGLAGALIVGVSAAKALALVFDKPYVGVNHHEGHLYAALIQDPQLVAPFMALIVSGGHTMIVDVRAFGDYRVVGRTVDDAAGEAFDKVARFCGLGYPGGPVIDRLASAGDPSAVRLPRPMINDGYDFSFSGLKTAVVRYVQDNPNVAIADLAAGFQAAAVDVLCTKLLRAAADARYATVVVGGGVAANSGLRAEIVRRSTLDGVRCVLADRALCTDNAAMIGAAACGQLQREGPTDLGAPVRPGLRLG